MRKSPFLPPATAPMLAAALMAGVLVAAAAAPARAWDDDGWHHHHGHFGPPRHDGRWVHDWHEGRFGWWWVTPLAWTYYPGPVPSQIVGAPAPQYYYFCDHPRGYYPARTHCRSGWRLVPAPPPPVAMPGPAMMPAPAMPPADPPMAGPAFPAPGIAHPTAPRVPQAPGPKEVGGTVLGAVGGAVAGAQFGHGNGKLAATALGTLFGAFLGNSVGSTLDHADQAAAMAAERQAYTAPVGHPIVWRNPDNGHSGRITVTREGVDAQGQPCREFQQSVTGAAGDQQANVVACRDADGSWQPLHQAP